MKICIATGIYPPSIGGPATYSKLLFDELPKRGIDVKVLSYDEVRHLPKGISHLTYFFKLIFKAKDCDIIFAQDPVSVGLPALFVSKFLNKKFFIRVAGDYAWEQGVSRFGVGDLLDDFVKDTNEYHPKVKRFKKIERDVAIGAEKIIVPSRYLKKIVTMWGVDENKIEVVYNAFDNDVEKVLDREGLRQSLQISGKAIVSVGRLVSWKGFDVLIETFKEIAEEFSDIKLFIIGDGPEKNNLEKIVLDNGLSGRVIFVGKLERHKVLEYVKASDIFVLNTKYEGLAHVILEALSIGTPVVTTNVCGNPELIENGVNGLLVDPDDKLAIKNSCLEIFNDKDLKESLVEQGRMKVKYFSKDRLIENLIKILK